MDTEYLLKHIFLGRQTNHWSYSEPLDCPIVDFEARGTDIVDFTLDLDEQVRSCPGLYAVLIIWYEHILANDVPTPGHASYERLLRKNSTLAEELPFRYCVQFANNQSALNFNRT